MFDSRFCHTDTGASTHSFEYSPIPSTDTCNALGYVTFHLTFHSDGGRDDSPCRIAPTTGEEDLHDVRFYLFILSCLAPDTLKEGWYQDSPIPNFTHILSLNRIL